MSDSARLSRRDWFRLRVPNLNPPSADERRATVGEQAVGLNPVAHPPNHDGMNLADLPPMREAMLSAEQVTEVFSDIEQLATDVMLMQRSSRSASTSVSKADTSRSLQVALTSLLLGAIPRVQLRYQWQGALWIDTLEGKPSGYRLVRITHSEPT